MDSRRARLLPRLALACAVAAIGGLAAHAQDEPAPFQMSPTDRGGSGASAPGQPAAGSDSTSRGTTSRPQSQSQSGQPPAFGAGSASSQPAPAFGSGSTSPSTGSGTGGLSGSISDTASQYFQSGGSGSAPTLQSIERAQPDSQAAPPPFSIGQGSGGGSTSRQTTAQPSPSRPQDPSLPPIETLTNQGSPGNAPSVWNTGSPTGNELGSQRNPLTIDNSDQLELLNQFLEDDTATGQRTLEVALGNISETIPAVDRPIVPFSHLRLGGEIDFRSWTLYLTAAQAARGATLTVAFTNSVLVLPEASELRVFLNTREILTTEIDSPDNTKVVAVPITADMVRPGANAIRFEVDQRHRIDCSLSATYELWTRIEPRLTGLSFRGGNVPLQSLAELPAVGVDTTGATRIRVLQPAVMTAASQNRILEAAQIMAVRGRFSQPLVEILTPGMDAPPRPGVVNLVMGTYEDISRLVRGVSADGQGGPTAVLQDRPDIGPTVYVAAPDERGLDVAMRRLESEIDPISRTNPIASTPPWHSPDAIEINGADRFSLRDAGVFTQEFSGRRFETHFQIELPPDFFAAAYGQATIDLDAAYTPAVRPGSRLNVYVNGILATALSFTASEGRVFNKFPVRILLKNFRPGVNDIRISVNLLTDSDELCLPGGTVSTQQRFVLFNTTEFVFPAFARIGRVPDLASFGADGFPYSLGDRPIAVRVSGDSRDTLGATASLLARMAVTRGRRFNAVAVDSISSLIGRPAIVVGSFAEVTPLVLQQTRVDKVIPQSWLTPRASVADTQARGLSQYDEILQRLRAQTREQDALRNRNVSIDEFQSTDDLMTDERTQTEELYDRWRSEVRHGEGLAGWLGKVHDWFGRQFDVSFAAITAGDMEEDGPAISEQATLIIAQAAAPQSVDNAWTLVTAPTPALLSAGVAALSAAERWDRMGGRLSAFQVESEAVQTLPAENPTFLVTEALSFQNIRLIAANWFSINNGIYAIVMILAAVFLGIFTHRVIEPMGRKK
ncbi:cellulose biosynthesis cyclic di-GMP-binding regulatory protein BcsB [Amorphus coralli]|uniref:cellulose biosynthesis cyclic di-GMP-binding regulatory protein BcsB n=1 Tax=Amorphus coralli TaxID=340680 RepID=UPI0003FCBE23|nr:cellulose biosynthesis cyclic di-GMP-binding regulatory protein BcsB [Amorphus coralli]